VLHSTELEKFLLDLDPRVTYWPPRERGIFDETFGVIVNPLQTDLESTLSVLGTLDPTVGRLFEQWTIHVTGATTVSIRKDTPISSTDTATLVISEGLSAPLPLQDANLDFVISNPTVGYKYIVTTLARPKDDLAILAERLKTSIGAATEAELFYQTAEPFQTFSNLWFEHDQLAYKLGGLLLALIYRIEDLRLRTVVST